MPSLLHKSPPAGSKPSASRIEFCAFLSLATPGCSSLALVMKTSSAPLALASPKTKPATFGVSSRVHHWLRLPQVPILKEQSSRPLLRAKFSCPIVPERSKNHNLLASQVE